MAGCASSEDGAGNASSTTTSTTTSAGGASTTAADAPPTTAVSAARTFLERVCTGAPTITDAGVITSPAITEASGIVASRTEPGVWWVHNDSGDAPVIYAVSDSGELRRTVTLTGATARDWEDIAIGPGATPDAPDLLYVGDIGDNAMLQNDVAQARESLTVYRLEEPTVDLAASSGTARSKVGKAAVDTLTLVYPDGPHDAEAMVVDPVDGDLLLITKDWGRTGESQVYRASADAADGSTTTLEHVGTVPMERGTLVTGADVSPDGTVVALRSYGAVELYPRPSGGPLWQAFDESPCAGPVPSEQQGESIGFAADGSSYMTVSEGTRPTLHRTTG